ncbi:MAG: amino acid permease [Gemmatimonadota bacterium]|nr:MAG: amino acid permease [Gemmatimonadota bacterium]
MPVRRKPLPSINGETELKPQPAQKFGTFLGVYTPSVLTILGLVMYLRFGWIVGNLGLGITILIVLVASSITFTTALSASAIATNMRVGVGGEYYLISHSLGLELGGAIGIPLFLCRTLSITFYSFGLAESILSFWPDAWGAMPDYTIQILTAAIIVTITAVSGKSAGLALKVQLPIMAAVGLTLVALMIGVFTGGLRSPEWTATYRTAPQGFWYVFAVFFPAVTGFTAGIGMSGDLKNPQRSIPLGTLLAVITGAGIYLLVPILLGISSRVSFEELAQPGIIWSKIAILGVWLLLPGIWGAILSSAFGSVLGGPRVLQALADDGLAPRFLSRVSRTGQPTIATWISGTIALTAVAFGGLNAVAQFVTILFLTLYVTINFSAGLEKLVGDPSYRPTINVPWYVSLFGCLGAVVVMFLINPFACVAALVLESILFFHLRRRSLSKRWGDVRAGLWVTLARFSLLKLHRHSSDPRNWRPHILLFLADPKKRTGMVRLANWFNQNRGIVTACHLIEGDLERENIDINDKLQEMDQLLHNEGLVAFSNVNVVPDYESGAIDTIQAHGIAGLKSNTVLFGMPKKEDRLASILRVMRAISRMGKSTIIANLKWAHEPGTSKQIDLWWRGLQDNGDLMLLLAHLLNLNPEWRDAKIVLRSIVLQQEEREHMTANLNTLIAETRIRAKPEVIIKPPNRTVLEVMHALSHEADIVFLGLMEPKPGEEPEYAARLMKMVSGFNTTIFVRNAGEFAGHLI